MKIKSLTIKNEDLQASVQEAAIATAIGYGKMYELLHKQLWRKGRASTINYTIQVNGKATKPIRYWNIKSPSVQPYDRDDYYNLGLNQLFAGQSYKDTYDGNPKDGIYHDDCLIQPKAADLTSNNRMGWYIEGNGHWVEKDEWGAITTTNVYTYEKFVNQVSQGMYYVVVTPSGSSEYPLADVFIPSGGTGDGTYVTPSVQYISFSSGNETYPMYTQYIDIPDMSEHGSVVYESTDVGYTRPIGTFTSALIYQAPQALTRVYADGTCVQFVTPTLYQYSQEQTIYYGNVSGSIKYLPLVYTDTGDLVQNRSDFIEQWDDMFELYVHEDGYWYTPIISILVVVISMVLAIFTGGGALAIMGAFISSVGAISGNKTLQIIGAVLSLGTSAYSMGMKGISQQAMAKGLSERTANQIATEATAQQVFSSLISNAGLSNLASIGSSAYSIYNTITMPELKASEDTTTEDDTIKVMIEEDDEEYSDKVMDLIKL